MKEKNGGDNKKEDNNELIGKKRMLVDNDQPKSEIDEFLFKPGVKLSEIGGMKLLVILWNIMKFINL